jgi:formylglycine-generating enzyme required for sulfatase activity
MKSPASKWAVACLAAMGSAGCSEVGEPRPQLVVIIDTDMPTSSQVLTDPALSGDAAIDSVRADLLPYDGGLPLDSRSFPTPLPEDWPLSFGVPTEELNADVPLLFRLRVFRGKFASGGLSGGDATIDPLPQAAIDRLIEIDAPTEGVVRVRVLLSGDCIGDPSTFSASGGSRSCIDRDRLDSSARDGLELGGPALEARPSQVGTWPQARSKPCVGEPPEGAVCIAGGFFLLGDPRFVGLDESFGEDAMPLQPAILAPFFIDQNEVTVGRLEQAVADGYTGTLPSEQGDPGVLYGEYCTFRADGTADPALPINCLFAQVASELCQFLGGDLPSEAQWEHAATGRGQRRLYPWGNEVPTCCTTSVSRPGPPGVPVECTSTGSGVEPVGSHMDEASCGSADVTRDGVVDMAGSLTEPCRDRFAPLSDPCWDDPDGRGYTTNPVCEKSSINTAARGGYWNGGVAFAASFWRKASSGGPTSGVRCVYPSGAP